MKKTAQRIAMQGCLILFFILFGLMVSSRVLSPAYAQGAPACQPQDIVLVIDASGSMRYREHAGGPARIDYAVQAAQGFLDILKTNGGDNVKVGLVTFQEKTRVSIPLVGVVSGYNQLTNALHSINTITPSQYGTCIGCGLQSAA